MAFDAMMRKIVDENYKRECMIKDDYGYEYAFMKGKNMYINYDFINVEKRNIDWGIDYETCYHICNCHLYNFFDEQEIYITTLYVPFNFTLKNNGFACSAWDYKGKKDHNCNTCVKRKDAEKLGFTKAFEILEKRLYTGQTSV